MRDFDAIEREEVRASPDGGAGARVRELAFRRGDLRFLIVDDAGADIAARLAPHLGSGIWPSSADTSPPDIRYAVETWQPSWGASGNRYRVSRDGGLHYLGSGVDRVVQWLRADIDETVARGGVRLVLRGAVVTWRERAILIAGRERSGTSRLAAELVRQGATPYADGLAVLDGEGRARPDAGAPGPPPLAIALIVSTTYRQDASWLPQRLRGARAVLPIIDSALPDGTEPRRVLRLCARLAATALTLQGPRPDASIAAPRILGDLDDWLDDRPQGSARPTEMSRGLSGAAGAGPGPDRAGAVAGEPPRVM